MDPASITDETGAVAAVLGATGAGNGDDAAVLRAGASPTCISTDTTVEGIHAPVATTPHALGRRAAARALSDLAAMGAAPLAMTCAVHVPAGRWTDAARLVEGVVARGSEQGAELVGGDFARTPSAALAATVTVVGRRSGTRRDGFVPRAGARAGDIVCVTGPLGAAAAALERGVAELPEPPDRLRAGVAVAAFAHAMVDLSDGLANDAAHVARASGVDIQLQLEHLPLAPGVGDPERAAAGGDDYELFVALASHDLAAARRAVVAADPTATLTPVGMVADGTGVVHVSHAGVPIALPPGFVHR